MHRALQEINRPEPPRTPVQPSAPDDVAFIDALVAAVRAWHADAATPRTLEVAAGASSFRRLLAYGALERLRLGEGGGAGFFVEKVGDFPNSALRLTRASAAECRAHEAAARQARIDVVTVSKPPPVRPVA